jgi:WD40 repeat protein
MRISFLSAVLTMGLLAGSPGLAQENPLLQPIGTFSGHTNYVRGVAFSPNGKTLTSAGEDEAIVWDAATGKILHRLATAEGPVKSFSVAYSPDGTTIAVGGYYGKVFLFDADTGKLQSKIEAPSLSVYSPDGKLLASTHNQATIQLFDTKDGKLAGTLKTDKGNLRTFAFSNDGKTLAAISRELLTIWDVASRTLKRAIPLESHQDLASYNAVACSPTMPIVAANGGPLLKQTTMFFDLTTFALKGTLPTDEFELSLQSIAFSPDGKVLATGAAASTRDRVSISLWDLATGRRIVALSGPNEGVTQVVFSADGGRVAASSLDKAVRIWEIGAGEPKSAAKSRSKSRTKSKTKTSAG